MSITCSLGQAYFAISDSVKILSKMAMPEIFMPVAAESSVAPLLARSPPIVQPLIAASPPAFKSPLK